MKNRSILRTTFLLSTFLLSFFSFSCKKHTPAPAPTLTVTDADGNVYQTITIGTQTWTTENLKTTKYNDGTTIPYVADKPGWANLATPAYTFYAFDASNKATYGALYNWHTIKTGKLAPAGWHVSTDADWQTLLAYLGGSSTAGDKLKEAGNTHWSQPATNATNESGFTALPGGLIDAFGNFANINFSALFWTSTESDASNSIAYGLSAGGQAVTLSSLSPKSRGFSIRLVKD
ncbi:MAG: fibrobacter succinogenes major paralogous domain-containing protein [Sphingobacteriaceae bacterium]